MEEEEQKKKLILLNDYMEEIVSNFEDPITYDVYDDPVLTNCGHTFNLSSLREWLKQSNTCPLCKAVIDKRSLLSNIIIRNLIPQCINLQDKMQEFSREIGKSIKEYPDNNSILYSNNSKLDKNNSNRFIIDLIEVIEFQKSAKNLFIQFIYANNVRASSFKLNQNDLKWNESFTFQFDPKEKFLKARLCFVEKLKEFTLATCQVDLSILKNKSEFYLRLMDSQNVAIGKLSLRFFSVDLFRSYEMDNNLSSFPELKFELKNINEPEKNEQLQNNLPKKNLNNNLIIEDNNPNLLQNEKIFNETFPKVVVPQNFNLPNYKKRAVPPKKDEENQFSDVPNYINIDILKELLSYGFTKDECIKVLKETNNDKLIALERLL